MTNPRQAMAVFALALAGFIAAVATPTVAGAQTSQTTISADGCSGCGGGGGGGGSW